MRAIHELKTRKPSKSLTVYLPCLLFGVFRLCSGYKFRQFRRLACLQTGVYFLPLLRADSVFSSIPWFRNLSPCDLYCYRLFCINWSQELVFIFAFKVMQDLRVNRKKKKRKREREVRETVGHCTDWLMTWQSYSVHLYSDKARRFIQIRTRKKTYDKR